MAGLIVEYAAFFHDASAVRDLVCNECHTCFPASAEVEHRLFISSILYFLDKNYKKKYIPYAYTRYNGGLTVVHAIERHRVCSGGPMRAGKWSPERHF